MITNLLLAMALITGCGGGAGSSNSVQSIRDNLKQREKNHIYEQVVLAIQNNVTEYAKKAINENAFFSEGNYKSIFLLHASFHGNLEIVKLLFEKGIKNIDPKDKNGSTPLYLAITRGNYDIAEFLIEKGAITQVEKYKKDTIIDKLILDEKISIIQSLLLSNNSNTTLLHLAVEEGKTNLVKLLIEKGADINSKDRLGHTVLDNISLKIDNTEIMKILLSKASNKNPKDSSDRTLLYRAVLSGVLKNIEFLINNGADVNAKNGRGDTPLFAASKEEIIDFLIEKGANINAQNENGITPLMDAVLYEEAQKATWLIKKGAEVNAKDKEGRTALDIAKKYNRQEIVDILEQN